MPNFNIKIENIVATTSLDVRIPLKEMLVHLDDSDYEPDQFPGLVYRNKSPKAAILLFSTGKIVCTGARTIEDVQKVIKKVVKVIKTTGLENPKKYNIRVENVVASAQLPGRLDLDKIAFLSENSEYEPNQFPGLVYRLKDPKATLLLFGSGKVICTGTSKIEDVKNTMNLLFKELKSINVLKKV